MRPIVTSSPAAAEQWRELVAEGLADGVLENRVDELVRAGVPNRQVRGRPGLRRIVGDGWVARFTERDRSPTGGYRITWRIYAVERVEG